MLAKSLHIKRFLKDDAVPTIYVAGIVPTVWEQLADRNRRKVTIQYSCAASAAPTQSKVKMSLNIM